MDTGGSKNGYSRIQNGYSRIQADTNIKKQWSFPVYKLDTETTPTRSRTGYRADPNIRHIVFLSLIMSFRERMSGAVSKTETLIDTELSRRKIDKYSDETT